jgi:hypothetical protein
MDVLIFLHSRGQELLRARNVLEERESIRSMYNAPTRVLCCLTRRVHCLSRVLCSFPYAVLLVCACAELAY